jgi:amino acid transporter
MPPTSDAGLVRAIGARQLTASIVNTTIGAGIFVLPAVASAELGAAAPIAYLVCAALMALIVCCFAAAGSRVSLTGGLYAYVDTAFGRFVGFLAGDFTPGRRDVDDFSARLKPNAKRIPMNMRGVLAHARFPS